MATSTFTPNLGLSAWQSTDSPKRIDFVNDNNIIDKKLGEHLNNSFLHLSDEQRAKLDTPYTVFSYAGDGQSRKTFTFDDSYAFAIVFQKFCPPVEVDSNNNVTAHFAIVGRLFGSSSNITMTSNTVTVVQDAQPTGKVKNNFNENEGQYVMLLFK